MLQINKTRTTANHSQSDGMIERLNRTVKDVLSKYISVHQNDWDKFVDGVVFAYNSTVHDTTVITPYRMVFGEKMRLPVDLVTGHMNDEHHSALPSEYVRTLEHSLSELYHLVRDETGNDAVRQKRYYDRNVRETNYKVGDLVRRNQRPILKGIKANSLENGLDHGLL